MKDLPNGSTTPRLPGAFLKAVELHNDAAANRALPFPLDYCLLRIVTVFVTSSYASARFDRATPWRSSAERVGIWNRTGRYGATCRNIPQRLADMDGDFTELSPGGLQHLVVITVSGGTYAL